jgi:serine/threonine protein kinase
MATTIKDSKASKELDISNQKTTDGLIERKKPKKKLSDHVMTRVYRAPEVITLMDYDKKVDTWSVGCILAELIRYTEEYRD